MKESTISSFDKLISIESKDEPAPPPPIIASKIWNEGVEPKSSNKDRWVRGKVPFTRMMKFSAEDCLSESLMLPSKPKSTASFKKGAHRYTKSMAMSLKTDGISVDELASRVVPLKGGV
jgi:hypothetical protein